MNEEVTYKVLQEVINQGAREFILCPGSRNSSFIEALRLDERLTSFYFPEERSGAFFALGRCRLLGAPVAIVTTSGTAAGELLPAAMEAHYSGTPLIFITADRPMRFRGSGAPQSAEQPGLFGHYVKHTYDIGPSSPLNLQKWNRKDPIHINVCLEEPQKQPGFQGKTLDIRKFHDQNVAQDLTHSLGVLRHFLSQVKRPIAIVSTLSARDREAVAALLVDLQIPTMLEGISGLRGDPRLKSLEIRRTDNLFGTAAKNGYPIDGVLRIGGVPTHRVWRDLEFLSDSVQVCGLSDLHFSGLSWNRRVAHGNITEMINRLAFDENFSESGAKAWLQEERAFAARLDTLLSEEPLAEPSLIRSLSAQIPDGSFIYLGNSLPIREWDFAAVRGNKNWTIGASRGINGIDGQLSTFLGQCRPDRENWAIIGDLTALYDLAGYWIIPQLENCRITIVIVNNGGGMIFKRMYPHREMLNEHQLTFRPLAEMWGIAYQCLRNFDTFRKNSPKQMIELIPDDLATTRFWNKYADMEKELSPQLANDIAE